MIPSFVRPIRNENGRTVPGSGWGEPRAYRGGTHNGYDFYAPVGTPSYAAASGTVILAAKSSGVEGNWLVIDHGGGWFTRYMHNAELLVNKGVRVGAGQLICKSGKSGLGQSKPHLHFDIRGSAEAVIEYEKRFGKLPSDSEKTRHGLGIPAEPLIPVDAYGPKILKRAPARGLVLRGSAGLAGDFSIPPIILIGVAAAIAYFY